MTAFDLSSEGIKSRGIYEESCHVGKSAALRGLVSIGAYSYVGERCWITNSLIGKYSWIENGVEIGSQKIFPEAFSNHSFCLSERNFLFKDECFSSLATDRFFYHKQPLVLIGNDVRICKESVIFAGIELGDGALVLPNSVVYDDVEPYSIVAGNPAKKIGERFEYETKKRIIETKWVDLNFSEFKSGNRKNYLDVDYIVDKINECSLDLRKDNWRIYNGNLKSDSLTVSSVAIQGPSHIRKWVRHIEEGELSGDHGYLMYGEVGLSLFSDSFIFFEKWWLNNNSNRLIFFVPDFRIGNSGFIDGKNRSDGVFIYNENINSLVDGEIYYKALKRIDSLLNIFGDRVKLVFWCLYGREKTNIKEGKYFKNGKYSHPLWNYEDIRKRYNKNLIDLDDYVDDIFKYIDLDGSIHPNIKGFSLLEKIFNKLKW